MHLNGHPNFSERVRVTLGLFPIFTGILVGLTDAFYVYVSAPHFFAGFFDGFTFVLISFVLYFSIGIAIALALAALPVRRLFNGNSVIATKKLATLYLSIFIVTMPALAFLFVSIPFSLFTDHFLKYSAIIVGTFSVAVLCIFVLYNLLTKIIFIPKFLTAIGSFVTLRRVFYVIGVSFVIILLNSYVHRNLFPAGNNSGKPNVILISLDTLSANHLSGYGYEKATSPNLDNFANEGVLFEKAFSHSKWTLPSHMSILTSTYPSIHQVIAPEHVLDESFVTMAELLQQNGYYCGAFVDRGRFGHVGAAHDFDRGFEFYEHYPERFNKVEKIFVVSHFLNFFENLLQKQSVPFMHTPNIVKGVLSWLKSYSEEKPFFLFLHFYDIHSEAYGKLPYTSPSPYNTTHYPDYDGDFTGCNEKGDCSTLFLPHIARNYRHGTSIITEDDLKYIISQYDGGISFVDDQMGRFFAGLKELNLDENTLVIITADHGEEFLEHGEFLHGQYYDEIVHIPLMMRLPGRLPERLRITTNVRHIDILPTVLDLLDAKTVAQIQGLSLLPAMTDSTEASPSLITFGGLDKTLKETFPYRFVRTDSFKLITKAPFDSEMIKELYNLNQDAAEQKNIFDSDPAVSKRLESYLDKWEKDSITLRESRFYSQNKKKIEVDEATLKELKSLGYLR